MLKENTHELQSSHHWEVVLFVWAHAPEEKAVTTASRTSSWVVTENVYAHMVETTKERMARSPKPSALSNHLPDAYDYDPQS